MDQKDITKEEIKGVIEEYYRKYKLPRENISNEEWNVLYNVLEQHFIKKDIMNDYNSALNIVVRKALYYASFINESEFSMKHILRALEDLVAFKIYETEINEIRKEIKNSLISKEDKLREILNKELEEARKKNLIIPNITEDEWFTAFDVIEAHFLANDLINWYYIEIEVYINNVIIFANTPKHQNDDVVTHLSGYAAHSLCNIIDSDERKAIQNEIKTRLNGRSLKK